MRIVTNEEMRKIDHTGIHDVGIPSLILMENAGQEAGRVIDQLCREKNYEKEILIFCGKGKNGGDGLVVARRLLAYGHKVRVFLLDNPKEYRDESAINLNILKNEKARISIIDSVAVVEEYFKSTPPPFFVVDALIGTGIKRNLEGLYYDIVETVNRYATELVALDIPSGVIGDTGQIAAASIQATVTISFGFPKLGHFLAPGAAKRGKLFNVDLGFPRDWIKQGDKQLLTTQNIAPLLHFRDKYGHKNSFGHSLLIGGSPGRLGAVVMASQSCLKMGTGLVTVASWEDSFPSLEVKLPSEIMNFRITKEAGQFQVPKPGLSQFSSLIIGPGLGLRQDGVEVIKEVLNQYPNPIVIDADGLNLISDYDLSDVLMKRKYPTILTPHPGEMARLLKLPKEKILEDPVGSVRKAVEKTGAIVVLKGATTLIHSSEGITWFNHYPNDGMATAGSGDVLAGMIGGLCGQKMPAFEATLLGVHLHSLAGRLAAENCGHRSMTAMDIMENIKSAFKELWAYKHTRLSPVCVELV